MNSVRKTAFWSGAWLNRLTVLFTGLFLLQLVIWMDKEQTIFLAQTVRLIEGSLLIAGLVEFLFPLWKWPIKQLLQLFLITIYTGAALGYHPVPGSLKGWAAGRELFAANAGQLAPFVWFTLGTWAIFAFTLWWMRTKWRILTATAACVALLAVRDSFSLLTLWSQVALAVLSGLALVAIRHFAGMKQRNPESWAFLADYPYATALPVILIIAVIMAAGMAMPNVPPTMKDPYTIWRNWQGQPAELSAKGTWAVPVSTANHTSGYSRTDARLGGGFDFDRTPVMTVESTHRSYWRGETRSLYTGRGWESTDSDKNGDLSAVTPGDLLPGDPYGGNSRMKTIEVKQTVTMAKEGESYPVLFGAFGISSVESINGAKPQGFDRLVWSARGQELRWNGQGRDSQTGFPKTYTIISRMPILDEAALRSASTLLPDAAPFAEYLQLPASLPARVRELALQITAPADNNYDKVKLLEQYLQKNFPYTNKPDLSRGRSRDFVDRFLFEIKEGYCDYYSTAMAVMTRAIGLPSRWVKGYAPGTLPQDELQRGAALPPEQLAQLDGEGSGTYTVDNASAHSWVEIYFPGYGWYPFEPTAGFSLPTAELPKEAKQPDLAPSAATAAPAAAQQAESGWKRVGLPVAVFAAGLMLLLALAWIMLRRSGPARVWLSRKHGGISPNQQIVAEFNRLLRYCRRKGYAAFEHETARETFSRWSRQNAWLGKDLTALLALFEQAKYSGKPLGREDLSQAAALVKKLRGEL